MHARLVLLLLCLATAAPATLAQTWRIQGPPGNPGPARGADERKGGFQDRRANFDQGREHREHRDGMGRGARPGEPPPHHGMSHEERRELRRQIRDHGRDIYRER